MEAKNFYTEFVEFVLKNADPEVCRSELKTELESLRILNDEGKLIIVTAGDENNILSGVTAFFLVPPMVGFDSWSEIKASARPFAPDDEMQEIKDLLSGLFGFGKLLELSGIAVCITVVRKDRRQTNDFAEMVRVMHKLTENRFFVPIYYTPSPLGSPKAAELIKILGFEPVAPTYFAASAEKICALF